MWIFPFSATWCLSIHKMRIDNYWNNVWIQTRIYHLKVSILVLQLFNFGLTNFFFSRILTALLLGLIPIRGAPGSDACRWSSISLANIIQIHNDEPPRICGQRYAGALYINGILNIDFILQTVHPPSRKNPKTEQGIESWTSWLVASNCDH